MCDLKGTGRPLPGPNLRECYFFFASALSLSSRTLIAAPNLGSPEPPVTSLCFTISRALAPS